MTVSPERVERYGERLFRPDDDTEAERLDALAATFDAGSRARLAALGIQPGWQCLEIGAGAGTMARWLADQVGAQGVVATIDRDTRFARRHAHPRLVVYEADIEEVDLGDIAPRPGGFDLIHSRMTLMHVRERERLLARIAAWLRPGGVLVVSDSTNMGGESSAHEAYRTTMIALGSLLTRAYGADRHHGRRYPGLLRDSGLIDVTLAVELPIMTADSPLTRFWELTFRQSAARLVECGLVEPDTIERALTYLRDPELHELSFTLCTAIGRRA